MAMTMTILRAVAELEMDVDIEVKDKVAHVERDDDNYVTVYGTETDGKLWYLVLNQELIDTLKRI